MIELERVKILGRCAYEGGWLWMTFSLSEVGFRVKGATYLRLRLRGDWSTDRPEEADRVLARYAVYLNGEKIRDRRMDRRETVETVLENWDGSEAEIRLVKLSECTQSIMALEAIETDGELSPLPDRKLKIEFIGDSITCGYGVEAGSGEETFTTATENAEKSYAGLTAAALGADAHLTAYSGHGLISGWTGDPAVRNETEIVSLYYEYTGRSEERLAGGKQLQEMPWDFGKFQPDYIVINLGTNDLSWCREDQERKAGFRKVYTAFLKTVRARNPRGRILCALGAMGGGLNEEMTGAVEDYRRESGDREIRTLVLEEQNPALDGIGADYHPSEKTQRKLAERVTEALRGWMEEGPGPERRAGLQPEDYMDPECPLCGRPGEPETRQPLPIGRIMDKLAEYEGRNDTEGAERHLKYWMAEAEQNRDERGQLTLNNEMMGFYRMRGDGEKARIHAERALELITKLGMEETVTAGTTYLNAGTVAEAFGDPEMGLERFRKARENYEKNLGEGDSRLGGLYNNMGLALTALGRYDEAEALFRRALKVMEKQEHGEPEQAITWLNMADNAEAGMDTEAAEKRIGEYLERAEELLKTPGVPRDAHLKFVYEKCAPVFGHYGYFVVERELMEEAERIGGRN